MKSARQEKILELIKNSHIDTQEELARQLKAAGFQVTQATVSRDIRALNLSDYAVVIGSEGQGVRPAFLQTADEAAIIPMSPRCESLNAAVAATVVLWQMRAGR